MGADWGFLADSSLRLFLAAVLGGSIGLEREFHDKPAGFRTHALVCLGSALVMIVSASFSNGADPGRIAAQVVSGIGFLGAGTIIRRGNITVGLTTAASLWATAGVGLAAGHPDNRFLVLAALGTALVLLTLTVFPRVESLFIRRSESHVLRVAAADSPELAGLLIDAAERSGTRVNHVRLERGTAPGMVSVEIGLERLAVGQAARLLQRISGIAGVQSVRLDGAAA